MTTAQYRSLWQALLAGAALSVGFSACGGLDGRKVTRGPDEPIGGEAVGGQGIDAASGMGTSAGMATAGMTTVGMGGMKAIGGEPTVDPNPFGGETFSGGAPPVLDGPPEVVDVSPSDEDSDVEPTGTIGFKFSEGLDEASVTSDNIQIRDGDDLVEGDLSYSGVVSTFTPTRRLSLLTTYDLAVSDGVTDVGGQPLKEPFTSSFTVRDGVWSSQRAIFADTTIDSKRQDVAVDARGNVLFVWTTRGSETGSGFVAYARWYNIESGLKAEVTLDDCLDGCNNLRLAVSPEGDAIVVWSTSQYLVRARRFVGGAWERQAQTLWTTASTNPVTPAVAIGGGQAVVAWSHHQTTPSNYYLIEMSAAALDEAWPTMPTSNFSVGYSSPNYESINGVAASVDNAGAALVVFQRTSSDTTATTQRSMYYARKAPQEDWEYPVKIPSSTASGSPVLASDGEGAMAVWIAPSGNEYSLVASRYTKTKQFVAPVAISDPDLKGYIALGESYALASSSKGFLVTWTQSVGNSSNTYATRFDVASAKWDPLPALVSDGRTESRGNTAAGIDAHGNALVVFDQEGATTSQVLAARFVASAEEWAPAEPLTTDGNDYGFPRVAVAANGVAGLFLGPTYRDGPLHGTGSAPRGQYRIFK